MLDFNKVKERNCCGLKKKLLKVYLFIVCMGVGSNTPHCVCRGRRTACDSQISWVSGIELGSSGLVSGKCLCPPRHPASLTVVLPQRRTWQRCNAHQFRLLATVWKPGVSECHLAVCCSIPPAYREETCPCVKKDSCT